MPQVAICSARSYAFVAELVEVLPLLSDAAPYGGVRRGPRALWLQGVDLSERLLSEGLARHLGGQLERLTLTSGSPAREAWAGVLRGAAWLTPGVLAAQQLGVYARLSPTNRVTAVRERGKEACSR